MSGFPASADEFVPAFGDLNNFFQQSSLNTSPGGVVGGGEASLTSTLNTNASTAPVSPLAFGASTPSASTTNNAPVTATTSTATTSAATPSAPTSSTPVKSGENTSAKSTTDGLSVGSFQSPSTTTPATSIPASSATSGGGFTFTPTTSKDGKKDKKDKKGSPTTNANTGTTATSTPTTAPTTNANTGATVASAPIAASTTNGGTGLEKNNSSTQNLPPASEAWIKIDPDQSPIKLSIGNNENIICGKVSAIWIKCSLGSGASDPISGSGSFNIFSS